LREFGQRFYVIDDGAVAWGTVERDEDGVVHWGGASVVSVFFRPFGAELRFISSYPTACAVGCILAPLRGYIAAY
jgi:hypothetical protein